jgi:hypothetical protein
LATTSSSSSSSSSLPDDEKKIQMLADHHHNNLDGRNERIVGRRTWNGSMATRRFFNLYYHDDYDWQSPQQ